jgi:hypothetical protein
MWNRKAQPGGIFNPNPGNQESDSDSPVSDTDTLIDPEEGDADFGTSSMNDLVYNNSDFWSSKILEIIKQAENATFQVNT